MKICVFQGTFNPIHNAHLRVAQFVVEHYDFDKLIFIPAYNPPHKECSQILANSRLEMVKLAVKNYPKFEVSDVEFQRKGKSYTYLTIKEFYQKYGKISFIIGTDAFKKIETWYETDKLKELIKFIVFVREKDFASSEYDYLKSKGYDFEFQPLSFEDISSTELRNRVQNNQPIDDLVPPEVKEYILENELYKN